MNEEYNLKGRVRTLQQRKRWLSDTGIAHCCNFESFDLELSPTGRVQQKTTYTHSEDVYGHSYFVYEDRERFIREIKFDSLDDEETTIEYEYRESTHHWIAREAAGIIKSWGIEELVESLLVSSGTYLTNGQPIRLASYIYDEGKLTQKISKYINRGEVYEIWISHFNSLGKIVETFGLKQDGSPLGDGRYRYEYDFEGRKIRVLSWDEFGTDEFPNHIKRYTYHCDARGNWIQRNEYSRFRSDTEWRKRKTFRKLTYY